MTKLTCAKAPCVTCPYRKDVPSGVWAAEEYVKLPMYDGTMDQQAMNGGLVRFDCHQDNGKLCAGWVGCHGPANLIALRLLALSDMLDPAVFDYKSPVPLFRSGRVACRHGLKGINRPGRAARDAVQRLMKKRLRRKG